jgi:hypothetical protein
VIRDGVVTGSKLPTTGEHPLVQARANTPARTTLTGLPILPKQEESIRCEHRNGFGAEPKVVAFEALFRGDDAFLGFGG